MKRVLTDSQGNVLMTPQGEAYLEPDLPPPVPKEYTGHVDTVGLTALGWDSYDIAWLQAHVWWDEKDDNKWKVSEANLAFGPNGATPITWSNRTTYKREPNLVFFPKLSSYTGTGWGSLFNGFHFTYAIPTHGWDTSKVTTFNSIFANCVNLRSVGDLSGWVTLKTNSIASMFYYCFLLTDIGDISNWATSNVTTFSTVFYYATSLRSLNLTTWDTVKVNTLYDLFTGCYSLKEVGDLTNWKTSLVTTMVGLFQNCNSLTYVGDLSGWDTSKVTTMASMFNGCYSLTHIGDLSNWETSRVTNMSAMFAGCTLISSFGDLGNWDVSKVTNMTQMFDNCVKLCYVGDLSGWDVSNVTNFSYMFRYTKYLDDIGDLSDWDTSNVTNFIDMFSNTMINVRGYSNWDTSAATTVLRCICRAYQLDEIDIYNWDLSLCTSTSSVGTNNEGFLGYQYTAKKIVLGPKFFAGATTTFYLNNCWSWTRDSVYESLYTNQTLRDSSSPARTVRLFSLVYDSLSAQDIADIATKNITLVRV